MSVTHVSKHRLEARMGSRPVRMSAAVVPLRHDNKWAAGSFPETRAPLKTPQERLIPNVPHIPLPCSSAESGEPKALGSRIGGFRDRGSICSDRSTFASLSSITRTAHLVAEARGSREGQDGHQHLHKLQAAPPAVLLTHGNQCLHAE